MFFIVHNSTHSFATSVIADYQGNAALGAVPLPFGTYTVDAYFNGTIPVNPSITLSDDYYESSSDSGSTLTLIADTTLPTITATSTTSATAPVSERKDMIETPFPGTRPAHISLVLRTLTYNGLMRNGDRRPELLR